ncbi:MAG TPA: TetR/AcrR family transcriptional regulator [Ilumatobacteraceae bacterium]|nr:TetR/AcrR family transcriptional regulator [Ilumatobacteraceae bacterium]
MVNDTRERILEALRVVLFRDGSHAVTLDAVAAEAHVSKGGLLYHFESKQAMFDGLYRQLADTSAAMLAVVPADPLAHADRYLRRSTPDTPQRRALLRSVLATVRSGDDHSDEATVALRDLFAQWTSALRREVTDPVLAETIRLVGDGIFFNELLGLPRVPADVLDEVIERLLVQIDAPPASDA